MVASAGDVDGGGRDDLLIGAPNWQTSNISVGAVYLVSSEELATLDGYDGATDGRIDLGYAPDQDNSFRFTGYRSGDPEDHGEQLGRSMSTVDDIDGDGNPELLLGADRSWINGQVSGTSYLVMSGTLDSAPDHIELGPPSGSDIPSYAFLAEDYGFSGRSVTSLGDIDGAGALGPGVPSRDLRVSPQHRMLVAGASVERLTGASEALVAARHLTGRPGICRDDSCAPVVYVHLLCARHEVLMANGAPAESLHPGAGALKTLTPQHRAEVMAARPDAACGQAAFARPVIGAREARRLGAMAVCGAPHPAMSL